MSKQLDLSEPRRIIPPGSSPVFGEPLLKWVGLVIFIAGLGLTFAGVFPGLSVVGTSALVFTNPAVTCSPLTLDCSMTVWAVNSTAPSPYQAVFVVKNTQGQTVAGTYQTVSQSTGSGDALVLTQHLGAFPRGAYTVGVFATSLGGVAVSSELSFAFNDPTGPNPASTTTTTVVQSITVTQTSTYSQSSTVPLSGGIYFPPLPSKVNVFLAVTGILVSLVGLALFVKQSEVV